jgi:hypothetical protein
MELLTGAPLSRIVEARKLIPLERAQALGVIRDIGAALSYAHTRGAVHGELNPQNVFITGSDGLRVMGFGDSHKTRQISLEPDLEMTLPFSKSTFASCQVLEGARADARDDVFSLGCIAYLLLSGAHPFPNSTAIEARAVKLRPRRPANLSGRQWQALRNALRWDRESRPADMQKWLSQLDLGAAKKLAPLHDLLQPPAAKESKFGLALGLVAGLSAALFAVYWLVNHRDMLASIDSTAPIRAPANPATPVATPPVAAAPAISAPSIDRANAPSGAVVPPRLAAMSVPASHPSAIAAPVAPAPAKTPAGTSKVELVADTVDVPARQPSAQVTVHRKGNLRGETSFTWWTESGTAKQGVDFSTVVPQLGYLADGKSDVSLSIPLSIAPHARAKSFYVVIDQSEGGASLGARTLTMVTLQPSD